jgi:hypothetical protein
MVGRLARFALGGGSLSATAREAAAAARIDAAVRNPFRSIVVRMLRDRARGRGGDRDHRQLRAA